MAKDLRGVPFSDNAHRLSDMLSQGGIPAGEARAKIRDALRAAHGVQGAAAAELGVSRATLVRLLAKADLGAESAALRAAAGIGGRRTALARPPTARRRSRATARPDAAGETEASGA
jgi:hypothetical protein